MTKKYGNMVCGDTRHIPIPGKKKYKRVKQVNSTINIVPESEVRVS